jgi:hypothetical protein
MFSDSVLEFGEQRKRKALATTTSFIVNCVALGVLLVLPLAFPEDLPKAQLLTFLVARLRHRRHPRRWRPKRCSAW